MQSPDTRPVPRWKILVIASASAGAGFAVILAVTVGSIAWYGLRPKPPKPWNTRAIRAKYSTADVHDVECFMLEQKGRSKSEVNACYDAHSNIYLKYELQNTTDYDYRLEDQSNVEIMEQNKVLEPTLLCEGPDRGTSYYRIQLPVFVPARHTGTIQIKTPVVCPRCNADKLKSGLKDDFSELVLFDSGTRYEIELPQPIP